MNTNTWPISVNPHRMLADLDAMRAFGACGTGVVRRAFSDEDIASRTWLANRMAEAGLDVQVDAVGNVFGIPRGEGPCLLVGSHSDTQPEGGWLDGVYGVVVGLEIARASLEAGGPRIACVSFQDEEGRFTSLTGSHFWTGDLSLEEADKQVDDTGLTLGDARRKRGGLPLPTAVDPAQFSRFLEIHIEQGPVLDSVGEQIGVVDGIVGIRTCRVTFLGEQNHAGTTPMAMRRDAFQGLVRFTTELNRRLAAIVTQQSVWNIGSLRLHPNTPFIVPGRVEFTVQWRDGDDQRLDAMRDIVEATARDIADELQLGCEIAPLVHIPATHCDPGFIAAMQEAAEELVPGKWRTMPSGALHDAALVSKLMPMGMMFVPSIKGISHNFDEDTTIADLVAGVEVFARAISRIANR